MLNEWLKIRADKESLRLWNAAASKEQKDFSKWVRGILTAGATAVFRSDSKS